MKKSIFFSGNNLSAHFMAANNVEPSQASKLTPFELGEFVKLHMPDKQNNQAVQLTFYQKKPKIT